MKHIFLSIILIFAFYMKTSGQNTTKQYATDWKKVETLLKNGLNESATDEILKIYNLAKQEHQPVQQIKALIELSIIANMASIADDTTAFASTNFKELEDEVQKILWVEAEIKSVSEPAAAIMRSLLAEMYLNYYQQNQWQILDRTETIDNNDQDISTWSQGLFHQKISTLYLESIRDEKLLKNTKLEDYDPILTKGNVRHLRPTLYDLLIHRALDYFVTDEHNLDKPAYAFEIKEPYAFSSANEFANHVFETQDKLSLHYQAILLFQKLLLFHQNDLVPDARIDADIKRIQFVNEYAVHPDKDSLYIHSLQMLANKYANNPVAAQARFLIAEYHHEKGIRYTHHEDTTDRYEIVKAVQIAKKIIQQHPKSEGGINAYNLVKEATEISFGIERIEKVNVPNEPFKVLIQYQNLKRLHFKIFKSSQEIEDYLSNRDHKNISAFIKKNRALKSIIQDLPQTNDHQSHLVDIKIDALPIGAYVLIASTDENLAKTQTKFTAQLVTISNISYINQNKDFFVLDRNTGKPFENAKVQYWQSSYDRTSSKNILSKIKQFTTNKNGHFKVDTLPTAPNNGFRPYLLEIKHGDDHLFLKENLYLDSYNNFEPKQAPNRYFIFTDRSIYRPGQTVYFKGIASNKRGEIPKKNTSITVQLQNVHGERVEDLDVSTNAYGTFSGQFKLPQGSLNGNFSFSISDQSVYSFRVEEYKRPTFSVSFAEINKAYSLNDLVKVLGTATAYAGNSIDGASVSYRVERRPRFIYPWLFRRGFWPRYSPMVITNGNTTTDAAGSFEVNFSAIPDPKIDQKLNPLFDYVVSVDITDRNGETRSQEKVISVSYEPIMLSVNLPTSLPADSLKVIDIQTKNTNNAFIPTEVSVKINRLKTENRLIRPRNWPYADQFVMDKETYISLFPHDEYDQESDFKNWKVENLVFEQKAYTDADKKFTINKHSQLIPGFYQIIVETVPATGESVKSISYLELTDAEINKLSYPQYFWTKSSNPIEPGETTSVKLGTAAQDVFLISSIERKKPENQDSAFSTLLLNNEIKTIPFSATEADRGGYSVSYIFVKHNRIFEFKDYVNVPWSNKELEITYTSFRDKTLPGSKESWKVNIKGKQKEKISAEMLASMYDASLDQFYPHTWRKPDLWSTFTGNKQWNTRTNFGTYSEYMYDLSSIASKNYDKIYDQIRKPEIATLDYATNIGGLAPRAAMLKNAVVQEMDFMAVPEVKKDEEIQSSNTQDKKSNKQNITNPVRTNFNETAFFYPHLQTDADGNIAFSFQLPDVLTKWKFQALANTQTLALGYSSKEIIAQKELMVQPNVPRFVREGDQFVFSTKIANLTDKVLQGTATFHLTDAETGETLDQAFKNYAPSISFTADARQSTSIAFPIEIPKSFSRTIIWTIRANAGSYSDGEQQILPVLSNRMLVTESMPLYMKSEGKKDFKFDKLLKSAQSSTLTNQALTVEYTSNPTWYGIQALPFLMESKLDCVEQIWNRFFANSLASAIAQANPKIRQTFEKWESVDTTALMSNLQKNEELKNILLAETPWLLEAKSEADQKKQIATLFDTKKMGQSMKENFDQLKTMQSSNGGFVWFKGGSDNRYMTQYILAGAGQLLHLNTADTEQKRMLQEIIETAIPYLDSKIQQDYEQLIQQKADLKNYIPDATVIHYLYARSYFNDSKIADSHVKAIQFFTDRSAKTWLNQSKYLQGMTALTAFRNQDKKTANSIVASLKENAIKSEQLGMYWKTAQTWWWYENAIQTQSLLIEAFHEIEGDTQTVEALKTWLLKNKQTNRWENTKSTANACYALLMRGTDLLSQQPDVQIKLDKKKINISDQEKQSGTGYFKNMIDAASIKPEMGNIQVEVKSANRNVNTSSWGSVYWQYFEDLDKITFAQTPLQLQKKIFVQKQTDKGTQLEPVKDEQTLRIGDKITVRIVLQVDRDMEYVHMKDMRASTLEPISVLSGYKWQDGLGYYESTKDASTNFFFDYLRKGTYVFEYPLFVTHAGDFSNGITTIQCMYAPEFTAHSEGIRVHVAAQTK